MYLKPTLIFFLSNKLKPKQSFDINIDDICLTQVNSPKYLGVTFDTNQHGKMILINDGNCRLGLGLTISYSKVLQSIHDTKVKSLTSSKTIPVSEKMHNV